MRSRQNVAQGVRGGDDAAPGLRRKAPLLQPQINQQTHAGGHFDPAQCGAQAATADKQVVADRQHVHRLHLPVPGVFVGMHDVKTMPGRAPGGKGEPQLVDPARARQRQGHWVVGHARVLVANGLRKNVDVMARRQLLHQGNRITLGTTTCGVKIAVQNGNAQPPWRGGRAHTRRRSS